MYTKKCAFCTIVCLKKCCLENQEDILPYQKYIDMSLNEYPKKNNKGELDFYTIYKEEYINIDKLLYKVIKRKSISMFVEKRRLILI